jgi:predicted dithiol-disulfide oxidoreductase (DUF899 family)
MTDNAASDRPVPQVADRATWQAKLDQLRVKEKAHTRAGDADGPVPLIDVFDAAPWFSVPHDTVDPLVAGRHFGILVSYLQDGEKVYETYWTTGRGDEVMAPSYRLLDRTVYGRQELWEDSPEGWPQRWGSKGGQFQVDGRPAAQWSRIRAGRDDELGPMPEGWTAWSGSLHSGPPAGATD